MGSGLQTRRGVLRKPAECKPPPKPPIIIPTCFCFLGLTVQPLGPFFVASYSACSLLHAGTVDVIATVSSVPALGWPAGSALYNCDNTATAASSTIAPNTWYAVTVDFLWPDGYACSAFRLHFVE